MKEKNSRNKTKVCKVITDYSNDVKSNMCDGWIYLA